MEKATEEKQCAPHKYFKPLLSRVDNDLLASGVPFHLVNHSIYS